MPDHPPDHIGWTLWRTAQAWRVEFTSDMVAAGYGWFGQARANLLVHIGPSGLRQSELVERARLTKQAVQQFVDELVADGILTRAPDEIDARARRVMLTEAGLAALRDADRIKLQIEARWRALLGDAEFATLDTLLRRLVEATRPGLPETHPSGKED